MLDYIVMTLDCADPEVQAAFWCAAVGYTVTGSMGQYTALDHPAGTLPRLLLQQVEEPKTVKNRLHLDLHVGDIDAEVRRLEGLGATRVEKLEEFDTGWITMTDPEGNEFCVCPSRNPS